MIERIADFNRFFSLMRLRSSSTVSIIFFLRRISDNEQEFADLQKKKDALLPGIEEYKSEFREQENRIRSLNDRINQQKATLNRMKSGNQGKSVDAFGTKLPRILNDIKHERFKGSVFGPIGMHVSLSDKLDSRQSAVIVERYTGFHIRDFLCCESEDRPILQNILRRHGAFNEHSVIVTSNAARITPDRIPGALTVLDLVHVDEDKPLVFNVLVDLCGLDKIVVEKNEEAISRNFVEYDRQNKETFKYGISKAVSIEGNTEVTYRFGNRMSEPSYEQCRHLLAADLSEAIRSIDEELLVDTATLIREQNSLEEIRNRLTLAEREFTSCNPGLMKLSSDKNALIREKRLLEDQLEDAKQQNDDDTSALEAEIEEIEANLQLLEGQMSEETRSRDEAQSKETGFKKEKESVDRKRAILINRIREQESIVERFLEEAGLLDKKIRDVKAQLAACVGEIKQAEAVLEEAKAQQERSEKAAVDQTTALVDGWDMQPLKIDSRDTRSSLERKIAALKDKQVKERQKIGLSNRTKAVVTHELAAAQSELKSMLKVYNTIREELKASEHSVAERRAAWKNQLLTLKKIVAKNFDIYMQKKGFAGTVKFNDEEQTLLLKTQTDNFDSYTQCSDVRQLSGGERSYTTLCLLLALGLAVRFL